MDLDTLIYIIATIVIFVVSLLGQNKNKKNKNIPVESEPEKVEYSLNDFEKILQRKEEFRHAHEMREEEVPVENSIETNEHEAHEIKNDKTESNQKKNEEKVKQKEEYEEKEDGFDLNSAIIYSSILERKKFKH